MLSKSDKPIGDVIRKLASYGVEAAYIVPTATGLGKSILDAHGSIREYLKLRNVHDYASQLQGDQGKKILRAWFVGEREMTETKVALYRPETKAGDPRIWPHGLKNHARAWNLVAVVEIAGELYFINASDPLILASIDDAASPIRSVLDSVKSKSGIVASKLLSKLGAISRKGFVDSMRPGDTGIGFTLETMLEIKENSSRSPDFEGIEIKASRIGSRRQRTNRVNLFSQVPDWTNSNLKNGLQILDRHGYKDERGRLQLYCTVTSAPNPQGLYFEVDSVADKLENLCDRPTPGEKVVGWELAKLRSRLAEKHNETFWVKALQRSSGAGHEQFHYVEVEHTRGPLVGNFGTLVEIGAITMDYALHEERTQSGTRKSRDHGYLFKILPSNLDLLFPPSNIYVLNA